MQSNHSPARFLPGTGIPFVLSPLLLVFLTSALDARPTIRRSFFDLYTEAVGSAIDTVPSHADHCGVCHYDFSGGGTRNPYGVRLGEIIGNYPNNDAGRQSAMQAIEGEDPDGDGFSTFEEVTDLANFSNTPTFPGLTPANVSATVNVTVSDISGHLVPSTGGDSTPPSVTLTEPNGGEVLLGNDPATLVWTATDASGIASIDAYLSLDDGATWKLLAPSLVNDGTHTWFVPHRPTFAARVRVVATDNAFNTASDESDQVFTIDSPPGGVVPSTLRDFDQPGTQPFEAGTLNDPSACAVCHAGYDQTVEPFFNWEGSMMANASIDPLFDACLTIANQDAPDSGDLCIRCHMPRGWLRGRSTPTDGSELLASDMSGVSCDLCHRLVDPFYVPGVSPAIDADILGDLADPPSNVGNGMYVVDPTGARRGPFVDATSGHAVLVSPFHREAALCGTCHDVSNPAFQKDPSGDFLPNLFDEKADTFSAHSLLPIERTYSEWFYSDYNTAEGVYAPQFGGNRDYVSTCQDCHMHDVTGKGCSFPEAPTRNDLPLHDMTGGSAWMAESLPSLYPGELNEPALTAGAQRSRSLLSRAASLDAHQESEQLEVVVTNETGHKLPTGYPEGRRIWIGVKFFGPGDELIGESGAYDALTGVLTHDAEIKIYEVKPGLDEVTAPLVGAQPGPSFHFVLNNKVFKDNRIPPRGYVAADFVAFGGAPVGTTYADGQHWDETYYALPLGAVRAEVTLYYQSTSKEYVEFLHGENQTDSAGQVMHDFWVDNGRCPPEVIQSMTVTISPLGACCLGDGTCSVTAEDACVSAGGTPHPGASCGDLEACCGADQSCVDAAALCCIDLGGAPQGVGSSCGTIVCPECSTGADCDDGNACTTDSCTSGTCEYVDDTPTGSCCDPVTGSLATIDDANSCTIDECQFDGTVSHSPEAAGTSCDDANLCTANDQCDGAGTCGGTTIPDCCAVAADCDDGNACTSDDCVDGLCANVDTTPPGSCCDPATGSLETIDDGNVCTADACQSDGNVTHDPEQAGAPCDDGDVCTETDACDGAGACVGVTVAGCCIDNGECDDGDECNGVEVCDAQNSCVTIPPEPDCNGNSLLDSCETDCNGNGIPDDCDISSEQSPDINGNGVPDECDAPCDGPESLTCDTGEFCKHAIGECDVVTVTGVCSATPASCPAVDDPVCGCDGVTYANECEADLGGVPIRLLGACPDTCDTATAPLLPEGAHPLNRYLPILAGSPTERVALRVTFTSLDGFEPHNGSQYWVGAPAAYSEGGLPEPTFLAAPLVCDPVVRTWDETGIIYVYGHGVVPSSSYTIEAVAESCLEANLENPSPALVVGTGFWGDVAEPFDAPNQTKQPDLADILLIVDKFLGDLTIPKASVQLGGEIAEPASLIAIGDILHAVDSFLGRPYPFAGPTGCTPQQLAAICDRPMRCAQATSRVRLTDRSAAEVRLTDPGN